MKKIQKTFSVEGCTPDAGFVLDRTDCKLLNLLQKNNQITNVALADQVGISAPPCLKRVKRLRDEGIITHDVALIDPFKIGQRVMVFVTVVLTHPREDLLELFERKMLEHPEIMQCHFISGEIDYLLTVQSSSINHYNEFSRKVFANDPNIKKYTSHICLSRVKFETQVQLPES